MNEIFGIPMTTFMTILVVLLTVCLLSVAWVAWRRPVIFKMGMRNIPRRRAQTVLIVVGLMLSTLIIAAALGTGDTVSHSVTNEVYDVVGDVDEMVLYREPNEHASQDATEIQIASTELIPASTYDAVAQALAGDPNVDGIAAMSFESVPVINETKQQGEPEVMLAGFDPAKVDDFGGLTSVSGDSIDLGAIGENEVVISETTAEDLNATAGDQFTIYYQNQPVNLTVAAIAQDSMISGVIGVGEDIGGMVVSLSSFQTITDQEDEISAVMISNTGGVRGSEDLSDAVVAKLQPALAGQSVTIAEVKKDFLNQAQEDGQIFSSIFLLFGLFSIAAGIMLIVLIFTMLAAERRSEMGMARAVGQQRSQLIQQFVSEGSGYAILAGLVGAAMGVGAAIGIALALNLLFGDFIEVDPVVKPRSMIAAYALGVVITFFAVVASSWKISRLNVVAAVRDLPDAVVSKRKKMTLFWSFILLAIGGLMTLGGVSSDSAFLFFCGMSMLPFGVMLGLRFFGISGRLIASLVGIYILLFWLLPESIHSRIFGTYEGDFEMFFLSGIFLVLGSTILIVQNNDVLLAGVTKLGSLFKSKLPAVKTAVAYPGTSRGRTGLTIAMFSLIVFSLIMIATMSANFVDIFLGDDANAGWDVRASSGTTNPVNDYEAALRAEGVDTSDFKATGILHWPSGNQAEYRQAGDTDWSDYWASGMNADFITNSSLTFDKRAVGFTSDEAVKQALLTQPNVAVVDSFVLESGGFGDDSDVFKVDGVDQDDDTFQPIKVEVQPPDGSEPVTWTIIGFIDSKIGSLSGFYVNEESFTHVFPGLQGSSYFVALTDPENSEDVAKSIEAALLQNGVQAVSIRDELEDAQSESTGFFYIIQGFMALGLIVGIAAVGVIAFRSVVERRQQIGVLRALGYQRGMVSLSFLIESAYVVGLGVISGTTLALILARNLFMSGEFGSGDISFSVPWVTLALILGSTIVAALLMTWAPARQASRIAPAEALRYE